MIKFKGQESM